MRILFFCLAVFLLTFVIPQNKFQSPAPISPPGHIMVVTAHPEATRAGFEILNQGGNAVDAMVAVQFALAVVYPDAGNLGGGGFAVLRMHDGSSNALDFREKAPEKATADMYVINGKVHRDWLQQHRLASGVPGSVDGMWEAWRKYGSMRWEDLLQPAVDLAEKGFAITARQADELNFYAEDFKKHNPHNTYLRKNEKWKSGDILLQPDLSATLKLIQKNGRSGFYEGKVADAIVKEMESDSGIITNNDLTSYHSVWREPVTVNYKNYKIISVPPPSAGGIGLVQLFTMVEPFPLHAWGKNSVQTIHVMAEAERRMYADRAKWLGDPDFVNIPVNQITDSNYLKKRMADFDPQKATPSSSVAGGIIPGYESEETTHFSIVDAQGNAVSVTTTLNDSYGSKVFVSGAGFLLNNEMDDFSAQPNVPNMYGLIGGKANAVAPGKRMLSNMSPCIVEKNDSLFMVIGTPGGATIINSVFQDILNVTEFGMTMQESVAVPRFHHQWMPDILYYEKNCFSDTILTELQDMGYKTEERKPFGRVDAILVHPDGTLESGADPRGDDLGLGY